MCWRRFLTKYEWKTEMEMVLIFRCLIWTGLEVVSLEKIYPEMAIKIYFPLSRCNAWKYAASPKTKLPCFQGQFHILKAVLPHALEATQLREFDY